MTRRRGALLDRDGVINVDHGYVGTRAEFKFMPGLFPFLSELQDLGYRLCVLTNQSGVARGYYSEKDYVELDEWMKAELAREGIAIDLSLACFFHPAGSLPELKRGSFWRKPNPGMVLEAIQVLRLDPSKSIFVGDKSSDLAAARNAGIGGRFLLTGKDGERDEGDDEGVADFAAIITKLNGS